MIRQYGDSPRRVAVLHGGPGAPGEVADLCELLAERGLGCVEPIQTALTLEGQIQELHQQLQEVPEVNQLIGWSWGAMLAYLYAARYPQRLERLTLVSSGPYAPEYAEGLMQKRLDRLPEDERSELLELLSGSSLDAVQFARIGYLCSLAEAYDEQESEVDHLLECQPDVFAGVWPEFDRLRRSGELLSMGRKILCPVVAIHGDYDCHPAEGVQKPLESVVENFQMTVLPQCGHKPWKERLAQLTFLDIITRL